MDAEGQSRFGYWKGQRLLPSPNRENWGFHHTSTPPVVDIPRDRYHPSSITAIFREVISRRSLARPPFRRSVSAIRWIVGMR